MTQHGTPTVTADVEINASPDTIYDLITDLPTLAELAEETASMSWQKGDSARPGAVFKGSNRNGAKTWTTTCTVTEAKRGQVFAFDVRSMVFPVAQWRYDITAAADGGCRVTESTWDKRAGWFRKVAGLATGTSDRTAANTAHIRATLDRLKQRAEGQGTPRS